MKIVSSQWLFAASLVVVGGFAGCDRSADSVTDPSKEEIVDTLEEGDGESELADIKGSIEIDGSSTVAPISEAAAEAFEKQFKNIKVTVATSGTGGGFKRFTKGETDISDASRPIKDSEFTACKENGITFVELPVAYDGLSIVVNTENNFVDQLTIDDLKKIFLKEGGATNWKQVNDAWPDTAIKIYAPGTDSGTFDYFFSDVVATDKDNEHPRDDMSVSENDNVLVTGVAGEKGGIGFFGASYYFANQNKVRAVKIVDPNTGKAVAPTPETIESGEYAPFSRPLFIYVQGDAMKRPDMREFVKFYLTNAPDLAVKANYVPLPQSIYELAAKHYEEGLTGTHFLTADLKKRTGPIVELYKTDNLVDTK